MTYRMLRGRRVVLAIFSLVPALLRADTPTRAIRADAIRADIAYLASDEASFITGASVIIDGGQLAEE